MPEYRIITGGHIVERYYVTADNAEAAEEKLFAGEWDTCDTLESNIMHVEDVEEIAS